MKIEVLDETSFFIEEQKYQKIKNELNKNSDYFTEKALKKLS